LKLDSKEIGRKAAENMIVNLEIDTVELERGCFGLLNWKRYWLLLFMWLATLPFGGFKVNEEKKT